MKLWLNNSEFIDTSKPIDISIPLREGENNVRAWYVNPMKFEPVRGDGFVGDVKQGGAVNFKNVYFNPHGNGTHTECVGHIAKEDYTINGCLKEFQFHSRLISVECENQGEDLVITRRSIEIQLENKEVFDCIVIRTLPNSDSKLNVDYSGNNPPYFEVAAIEYLNEIGVKHLIVDLPSLDREVDGGAVAAHHCFWNYPENPWTEKTISELVYVPDEIEDGHYILNFQITSIELDASPSKIVLHEIFKDKKRIVGK